MKTKITERLTPIFKFFNTHPFVLSLILCGGFFLLYFSLSGFNIISGNDDYCIFRLVYFGDIAIPCMGFFFTGFISLIQPLFGNLNSYIIIQELICFGSLLIVNYVLLSKFKNKTGFFFTLFFDVIYFSFITIEVLFTYTSVVACAAGLLLILYAALYERKKGLRVFHLILGFLFILTGSQVRFDPLKVLAAVFFVLALGVLLSSILKNKKELGLKASVWSVLKKYAKTVIIVVVAFVVAFGANAASSALKHTVEGYDELAEYNSALSSVVDYNTSSYFEEKEFYKTIDMNSSSDISVLKHWFIDEDFFTVDRLNAINEYSRANTRGGIDNKGMLSHILYPVTEALSERFKDGILIIYIFSLVLLAVVVIIIALLSAKTRAALIKLGILVLLWSFFYLVAGGFVYNNLMSVPIMILTLFIAIRYNAFQYIIALALTLVTTVVYFYSMTLRLWFHVSLTFFFPVLILMIFTLEKENRTNDVSQKKAENVSKVIMCSVLLICAVVTGAVAFTSQVRVLDKRSNAAFVQYVKNNPDTVFLINQTCLCKDYYDALFVPEEKQNAVNYGLWVGKSRYMKNTRERNGIKHLFEESINGNMIIPVYEAREDGVLISKHSETLSDFYTEHYAKKGEKIELQYVDRVENYTLYKVVSKKAEE